MASTSYTRELGFSPVEWLASRIQQHPDSVPIWPRADLASIRLADGRPAGRRLSAELRAAGFTYDARHHHIRRTGYGTPSLPYTYLGADDEAGPNYTVNPPSTLTTPSSDRAARPVDDL